MSKLIVMVNIPSLDADGKDHRAVKEIDLWSNLTAGQQTAVTKMMDGIAGAVLTRYGATARIESVKYEA